MGASRLSREARPDRKTLTLKEKLNMAVEIRKP